MYTMSIAHTVLATGLDLTLECSLRELVIELDQVSKNGCVELEKSTAVLIPNQSQSQQRRKVWVVDWKEPPHIQAAVEYLPGLLRPVTTNAWEAGFWTGDTRHMGARDYGYGKSRPCWGCWDYDPSRIDGVWDDRGRLVAMPVNLKVEWRGEIWLLMSLIRWQKRLILLLSTKAGGKEVAARTD